MYLKKNGIDIFFGLTHDSKCFFFFCFILSSKKLGSSFGFTYKPWRSFRQKKNAAEMISWLVDLMFVADSMAVTSWRQIHRFTLKDSPEKCITVLILYGGVGFSALVGYVCQISNSWWCRRLMRTSDHYKLCPVADQSWVRAFPKRVLHFWCSHGDRA